MGRSCSRRGTCGVVTSPSCALVELNDGKLTAHFLDVDGEAVSPPINLEAMG